MKRIRKIIPGRKARRIMLPLSLATATLAIGIVLGLWQLQPPPVDETSPLYPSYQRMMENIQKLTSSPHPSASEAIETVRRQILTEIEDMGLTPTV